MNVKEIEDSLSFMIQCDPDLSDSDRDRIIAQEHQASSALQMFMAGKISFQDFIDLVEDAGIDIDEYLENSCLNLEIK